MYFSESFSKGEKVGVRGTWIEVGLCAGLVVDEFVEDVFGCEELFAVDGG